MKQDYSSHFDAFVAFAKGCLPSRSIDHSGWCHCAVGNFHKEATTIPPADDDPESVNLMDNESPLLTELEQDHPYIYNSLNNGSVMGEKASEEHEIETYQGMGRFLEAFAEEDLCLGCEEPVSYCGC